MPDKQAQEKKSVQPSRGFLSRMFGSDEFSPEMQQGIDIARKEMPGMAPVEPYGFFSRLLQPKALGYASPGNTIYMNPATNQGQSPQNIADTLTHEQTHIGQNQGRYGPSMNFLRSLLIPQKLPYGQRPDEMAAFQAEKERRYRMGRPASPVPSFDRPGEWNIPQDVNLRADTPKPRQNIMMPKTMY